MNQNKKRSILSIAGSDTSGGAGVQGDLKVFAELGVHGCTVITAITGQNRFGAEWTEGVKAEVVAGQIQSLLKDIKIEGIKIGMVYSQEIARRVKEELKHFEGVIVIDPVLETSFGQVLYGRKNDEGSLRFLKEEFLTFGSLITPNRREVLRLCEKETGTEQEILGVLAELYGEIGTPILMTGGDTGSQDEVCDILYDGKKFQYFKNSQVRIGSGGNIHGTGCGLSSALAVYMSGGESLENSIQKSQEFLNQKIKNSYELYGNNEKKGGKGDKNRREVRFL